MLKFEELKRPETDIEVSSIKPAMSKVVEFYTNKVREYHNAFNDLNKYIDKSGAQLKVMADEIYDLKSQLQQQAPIVPESVYSAIKSVSDHYSAFEAILLIKSKVETLTEEKKSMTC